MVCGRSVNVLTSVVVYFSNNSSEARSWKPEDAEGVIASRPRQLIWNLSEQSKLDILKSAEKIDKLLVYFNIVIDKVSSHFVFRLVDDTDLCVFVFKHFGKNFIKTIKQSPDAYIQVCIQLAYYRYVAILCIGY